MTKRKRLLFCWLLVLALGVSGAATTSLALAVDGPDGDGTIDCEGICDDEIDASEPVDDGADCVQSSPSCDDETEPGRDDRCAPSEEDANGVCAEGAGGSRSRSNRGSGTDTEVEVGRDAPGNRVGGASTDSVRAVELARTGFETRAVFGLGVAVVVGGLALTLRRAQRP